MRRAHNSVDPQEISHFAKDSGHWWDEAGPFKPLHRLNPVRIGYIRSRLEQHFGLSQTSLKPFKGLKILDIGCGGGLACEALARLGGTVTGLDADAQAIEVARAHAGQSGLDINYLNRSAESLLQEIPSRKRAGEDSQALYDAVLALEIIEHVNEPAQFVETCAALCRPGGIVVFSTLNRTARSFALGIIAAEHILGWVPRGTHDWKKFVKPSELARYGRNAALHPNNVTGLIFNPAKNRFELSDSDIAVNYLTSMEKKA